MYQENPKFIQSQIIEYLISLKTPQGEKQYLAAIMTYYDLNEIILNKKRIYRYLGEEERPIENRGYSTEEIANVMSQSIDFIFSSYGLAVSGDCMTARLTHDLAP